ncbi:hypothetical protein [Actinacidiphila reveromycinica]|nr:hypothetical protein [Streptomyces sp. SN-593]
MTDEERELSDLLERVVPQLPAPAQRWERVRERMRRRRRRRAAVGASVTTVVVVAAAGLLLPQVGGGPGASPSGTRVGAGSGPVGSGAAGAGAPTGSTAATGAPASDGPTPSSTLLATAPSGYRLYLYPDLAGLRLTVPHAWYALKAGTSAEYVSTQALAVPEGGCDHALDDFCTPLVHRLDRGGALLQLSVVHGSAMADKFRLTGRRVDTAPVATACSTVGGTVQLTTVLTGPGDGDDLVTVTACLAQPTAAQQARVRHVLNSADFT